MGKSKSDGTPSSRVSKTSQRRQASRNGFARGVIVPLSPSIKQSKTKDSARAKLVR
jgi:hypothetical protein